jgi:hypothetical protein
MMTSNRRNSLFFWYGVYMVCERMVTRWRNREVTRSVNHTRDLRYHPHIHYLVPAGAVARDGRGWLRAKGQFLVHTKPLAALFRGKLRAGLRQLKLEKEVATETWSKPWVVDCRPVGSGEAALKYLAPYVFRVALSNNRLVGVANEEVTFRYRDGESKKTKLCTLPAEEFIRRFLYGFLSSSPASLETSWLFSPHPCQRFRAYPLRCCHGAV